MPLLALAAALAAAALASRRPTGSAASRALFAGAVLALGAARSASAAEALTAPNPYADAGQQSLTCRVVSDPETDGLRQRYHCLVTDVDGAPSAAWQAAVSAPRLPGLRYGDSVHLEGEPETPTDRGYALYLRRRGVTATVYAAGAALAAEGSPSIQRWLYAGRRSALAGLQEAVPQPEAAFISGVALGTVEGMPDQVEDDLRRAGLIHILVVSGANVAFVAGLAVAGLRRWLGWGGAMGTAALLCVGYCLITGGDPPVVRGAVMVLLSLGAHAVGRPGHGWTALALAAAAMAVANPLLVSEPSYQLSVATSGGMLSAQGIRWSPSMRRSRWWPVAEALTTTMAAQMAALPISAAHFGRLPGLVLLSNALVLPLQPAQMLLAMAAALTAAVSSSAAVVVALPAWLLARVTLIVAHSSATLPLASLVSPPWPAVAVLAYYSLFVGLVLVGPRRLVAAARAWIRRAPLRGLSWVGGLGVAAVVVWAAALQLPDGRLHVSFLDVGQGDAILVTTPSGARILVDGGPDPDRLRGYLGQGLPVWDRSLDVVVLTHPDLDHMGGLLGLRPRYSMDLLLRPAGDPPLAWAEEWKAVEDGAAKVLTAAAGLQVDLGDGVELQVLYPPATGCPTWGTSDNDCCTVLRISYRDASFLLTGDAEGTVETMLASGGALEPAWALKVSHHGSSRGTGDGLLTATRPSLAVISVGGNRYGHPSAEVLDRLRLAGVETLRTDQLGTIEIETDGSRYSVRYH